MSHTLPVVCTVRVVYAYLAREEGDLTLNKGDIIQVHDDDGGWWKGTLLPDHIYGNFPSNFVERINSHGEAVISDTPRSPARPQIQQQQQQQHQQQRPHSRQASTDSSKFTKRKPVNTMAKNSASSSSNLPPTAPNNVSSVSLTPGTPNVERLTPRKNPQAIIGDFNNFETPAATSPQSTQKSISKATSSTAIPGAWPSIDAEEATPASEPLEITNEAVYDPGYASQSKQTNKLPSAALLKPSTPGSALSPSQVMSGRHVANRYSMPNLTDGATPQETTSHANELAPGSLYLQDSAHQGPRGTSGTQSAYYLPQNNLSGVSLGDVDEFGIPKENGHVQRYGQNYSEDGQHAQPGMMPRYSDYYSQQFSPPGQYGPTTPGSVHPLQSPFTPQGGTVGGSGYSQQQQQQFQQQRGYRHSISNFNGQYDPAYSQQFNLQNHSELSLENLANHNRSHSALDPPKAPNHASQGGGHGRSRSQVNLRPEGSAAFNPYDHQQQHQQQQTAFSHQAVQPHPQGGYTVPMNRMPGMMRAPSPSIVIPQPRPRPNSAYAAYGQHVSPSENSPTTTSSPTSRHPYTSMPGTPTTGDVTSGLTSPTSAGTSMSGASAGITMMSREQRRKSDIPLGRQGAVYPDQSRRATAHAPLTSASTMGTFSARKFSGDAKSALAAAAAVTAISAVGSSLSTQTDSPATISSEDMSADIDLSGYKAKKPKASLIRAFKQILNPKKVAEKDALKNKKEHFAWIEMQKSLKRVSSPDPNKEGMVFFPRDFLGLDGGGLTADGEDVGGKLGDPLEYQDPFEILARCQVLRDAVSGTTTTTAVAPTLLDFGPNTFIQVDKVARNVNQRGPHMTPQLLSQKYLTRPYSKAPLSKLRVLFVWVSENIRLEGGPTRDVSGGRYKLGPAGDHLAALASAASNAGSGPGAMKQLIKGMAGPGMGVNGTGPGSMNNATPPFPAAYMTGYEEYQRGFLQEDSPELAQEVLASRMCKTGEGFANLFAEMALAAGIEDVGVVKGYIRGPMDVFSKEVPGPNHAWNVVRIDGSYRFIDCCLASPFHPGHYPNRPTVASSFYFMTPPMDLVLSHFPVFLTYQYITPSIPPQVFCQLPFVRPGFFEFGLRLVEFRKRTRLWIKDEEPVEVLIRIDGSGNGATSLGAGGAGAGPNLGTHRTGDSDSVLIGSELFGGLCLGNGCGEGIELRAEVEAMTAEGKVIRKRGLAQVAIWNPYPHHLQQQQQQKTGYKQHPASSSTTIAAVPSGTCSGTTAAVNGGGGGRLNLHHHCSGVRLAKIKAVLPAETVVGAGGIRKGVVHIYAGRKVENAPSDATPYSLALSLPIRHRGTMPKTPMNFVLPHFSPYEFYIKAPQTELLYYPHTYKFCVLSLAAQAQASAMSAMALAVADQHQDGGTGGVASTTSSPRHMKSGGMGGGVTSTSASMAPLYRPPTSSTISSLQTGTTPGTGTAGTGTTGTLRFHKPYQSSIAVGSLSNPPPPAGMMYQGSPSSRQGVSSSIAGSPSTHPYQHHPFQMNSSISMASTCSLGGGTSGGQSPSMSGLGGGGGGVPGVPRPERLVLRTQTNRLYKLVYDPLRQCHEAQVEVKERGIWECVRMDDGGKSRVGREGTGGMVIASWKCV